MSLKKQMILYFSCLMIGIFILVELINGSQAYSLLEKNITSSIGESLGLGLKNMDYYFQNTGNICASIMADEKVQEILKKDVENNLEGKILFRELNKIIAQYSLTAPYITKIYLLNSNRQIMSQEVDYNDYELAANAKESENLVKISSLHQTGYIAGDTKVFSLLKEIYAYNDRTHQIGTIVADVDYHIIDGLIRDFTLPMNGLLVLVDEQEEIFIKETGKNISWNPSKEYKELLLELQDKDRISLDGKPYIALSRRSEITGFKMLALIPGNELVKSIFLQLRMTIFLLFICLTVIGFVTRKIIFSIYDPLNLLLDSMSRIEKGDFNTKITYNRRDEFSTLINGYNIMVVKIKALLEELIEKEKTRRNAELYALQAQINPHFLYNTLNSIRYFAKAYNIPEIKEITSALIQLSKASLSSEKFISIGQEIALTKQYLAIQKIRYGDILKISYHIDSELKQCMIPRFSIQPIVENSLFHGILPQGQGEIDVVVSSRDNGVQISIRDNGIGMEEEQIDALNESLGNSIGKKEPKEDISKLKNIGLENIHYRIKMHYKNGRPQLWLAKENPGTSVYIWIPEKIYGDFPGNGE
ncbi:MAG: histidine kinase [Lachnospiraceae bacterium]|jgi:two-component system sensor histidine kinase YesM|nr:histidine kinase [Lachnospiraceae bacterium]